MTGDPRRIDAAYRILTWIGIINQLSATRASRALAALGLPFPQFVLLNHFVRRGAEVQTVTRVAHAMQQPQPGVTKTIQKMLAGGLLAERPHPQDGRSKQIVLTPSGRKTHQRAIEILDPAFAALFADWETRELEALYVQLDRIKVWMDTKGRD